MTVIFDPEIVDTEDGGREQRWPLPTDEDSLLRLIRLLFDEYWNEMWFGLLIEGSALEVAAPNAPKKISMYDGYATVDFGRWHFHLCIGEHTASGPELGRIRRCSRAELYRRIGKDDAPTSWGARLFNGRDVVEVRGPLENPAQLADIAHRCGYVFAWSYMPRSRSRKAQPWFCFRRLHPAR